MSDPLVPGAAAGEVLAAGDERVPASPWRASWSALLLPVVASLVLGAGAGWLWQAWAPRPQLLVTAGGADFADGGSRAYVAADVRFVVVTAAAGLLLGGWVWWRGRGRPVLSVVGLLVGGVLGALVARWVGERLGFVDIEAVVKAGRPGQTVTDALTLTAAPALAAWPLAASGAWLLADLLSPADQPVVPPVPPSPPSPPPGPVV